jgi:transposase
MAYNQYDDETKTAVIKELLAGDSVYKVADRWDIPIGTIKSWKSQAVNGGLVTTEKQVMLGELLLGLLEQEIITLQAIAQKATDQTWLDKQRADSLAVLFGVIQDKMFRKIEAINHARIDDTAT